MSYKIQEIKPLHDAAICEIIKKVGEEFGVIGEGVGPSDSEVNAMSQNYKDERSSRYFVATVKGRVAGGSGIAPFNGSNEVCELRKGTLNNQPFAHLLRYSQKFILGISIIYLR